MNQIKYEAPRTELERGLSAIWAEVLGLDRVGLFDNFFDLGGNSHLAIQLLSHINCLGYGVKLTDIFVYPTIAELSKKISGPQADPSRWKRNVLNSCRVDDDSIIPIQKTGELPPVFVVHNKWLYAMLAHYLGKNQPFYCLERAEVDTIEEIAFFYISKIKTVQSTGPYYLGGFCGFGMIALEMARQLAAQGEEVAALFLFESYSPTGMVPRLSWKYMKLSYNKLVKWPSLNRKKYLKDELRQTAKALLFATIKRLTNKKLIKTLSGRIILVNHRPYDYSYSGKVLLFKASYPDIWVKDDPKMGWSGFFTGDVETVTIEGDHTDIFKVPGVVKMAKVMKSVIASRITYVACFFPLTLVL